MATNTEVAGISIGITADIGGLSSSLSTATSKINSWMQGQQKKSVGITVEAIKGQSWTTIEADLTKLVERATAGHSVPIDVDLHIENPAKEKERLETVVKNQLGSIKVPIDIEYNTHINIASHVEVTWSWADGHGPPTQMGGGPSGGDGGGDGGTPPPTKRRGKKTAATGATQRETTQEEEVAPQPVPRRGRKATPANEGGTVTVKPTKPTPAPAEEKPAGGGIAAMPTTTPKTAAGRKQAEEQAANTAAYVKETGETIEKAAREWRNVTRATFMRNLQRPITGMQPLNVRPEALEAATGYQAEYEGTKPTGSVAYVAPGGATHRLLRSRVPRTFEGTTHGERPTEGRVTEVRRGDPEDPRRQLGDMRSMRWFDPGGGFDPAVTAHSRKLFETAMAEREEEVYKKLKDTVEQRQDETHEEFRGRLMRDWTGSGYNAGKARAAKTIAGMAEALQVSPAMAALDDLRAQGKFGEFFGDEETPGALRMRADAASLIRQRKVQEAEDLAKEQGVPFTDQMRKAAMSKGTARARSLRGGSLPIKERPEEALYLQLNAMIGQGFAGQFYAEQAERQKEAGQKGVESTFTNELIAAYTREEGERPIMPGQRVRSVAVPTGKLKEVIDRDKGLRTTGDPRTDDPSLGMWNTKFIPEMIEIQDQAGEVIKRQQGETAAQHKERVAGLIQDWDQGLRDFAETFEMPGPGGERAPRPRQRKPGSAGASAVPLTDFQEKIKGWNEELERLGDIGEGGEGFDQERFDWLEETLANIEAGGGIAGSRRARPNQASRISRYEALVGTSQEKLAAAVDPGQQAYYQRQLRGNQAKLAAARRGTTAERGLTGAHRTASQQVRANIGFCEYCGKVYEPGKGHADHPISRAHGGGQAPTGGPEHLVASCPECNIAKGDMDLLEWLQSEKFPQQAATINPRTARAAQAAVHPERMWDVDVLGLRGSARSRTRLERLGGVPQEVPDVRDIAEAMGIGRGGFGASGQRTKITAGSREKMQRVAKGAEIEKVFALIGDRYIDEAGRVLNDIREVIELETDPKKTSAQGFAVSKGGMEKLRSRTEATGGSLLGIAHSHLTGGLGLSEPGAAAVPGQDDATALAQLTKQIPGFISAIIDPKTKEAIRFYQQGGAGPVARSVSTGKNIPRATMQPATAQAASPVSLDDISAQFNQLSDESKQALISQLAAGGIPLPAPMQAWANAQAQGAPLGQMGMFANVGGGQAGPSPFRWNMGAAGAQARPGFQGVAPQPGAAAGGGAAPPPVPGQGWFNFQGGGFNMPPPAGGGAGPAAGFQPSFPYGQPSRFQRSSRDIREAAYVAGMSVPEVESVTQPHMIEAAARRETLTRIQGQITEDIAKTPVRAFTTAIGQYVSNLVVRGDVAERRIGAARFGRLAERATGTAEEAGEQKDLLQRQLDIEMSKVAPDQAVIDELESGVKFQTDRHQRAGAAADSFIAEFEKAGKGVAPLSTQMLNLGAITVSMLGAMIAFQAAMKVAQAAMDELAKVAYDGMETFTGFNATLARVQGELAKAALETGGVRGAVAQGFAAAGMEGTPRQRALFEGQVGAVVATQRATMQRDMLRTAENLRQQAPGAARFGLAPGLVRPTGGLFGTVIGAQPSLDEVIGNEMERLNPNGGTGIFNMLNERAPFTGTPFTESFDPFGLTEAGKAREQSQLDFADNLNRELESVGNTAKITVGSLGFTDAKGEREKQAAALDEIGANEIAAAVRAGSYEIRDASGNMVTSVSGVAKVVDDLGEALELPSGAEVYRAGQRAREGAMMQIEDQFRNQQRGLAIGEFRNLARNQRMPFGTTFDTGDAASRAARQAFEGQAQDLTASRNMRMERGRQEAIAIGVPEADLNRLKEYGKQITAIRTDLTQRQLAVSTSAYTHQLEVAKRTLGDLVGLTGDLNNGQATSIGLAEKENLELERRNTVLSREIQSRQLAMSQREINFNLAVAGFSAAGATPAEAAARMEEAKIKAEYEQANLNAQKEIFENQGIQVENQIQIVDETNLRSLTDAVHAVEQLAAEHELEKYAAGAEEVLAMLEGEADFYGAQVDAQIARSEAYVTLAQDEIRRVYVESGELLTGVQEDIADAFQQIREDYDEWLGSLDPGGTFSPDEAGVGGPGGYGGGGSSGGGGIDPTSLRPGGSTSGDKESDSLTYNASGALFNTTGTTSLIAGEAGTETVAILRNPRQMSWDGGGGGQSIQININNPVVRNDSDIEAIARAVEETLRQRAALVRPR